MNELDEIDGIYEIIGEYYPLDEPTLFEFIDLISPKIERFIKSYITNEIKAVIGDKDDLLRREKYESIEYEYRDELRNEQLKRMEERGWK